MPTTGLLSVREARARQPMAAPRFNLVAGLGATTLAAGLVLLGLLATELPPPSFSSVFFSWAPTGAAVALPIVAARARRDRDPMLGWFAAGLLVCLVAMVLQVLSLPAVDPSGGAFETGPQGNAALYLLFHLALYAAAAAGALRVPTVVGRGFAAAGVGLAFAFAANVVPLPELLVPVTQDYTPLLVGTEVALAVVGLGALALWSRAAGTAAPPIRAWIGLALLLSVFEIALNAVAAERHDPMWWSSLSLRLATFGLLAVGCLWTVVRDLSRVERYSEVELDHRDREIQGMVAVTDLLLANAQRLGQCREAAEVASAVEGTLLSLTGVTQVSVATVEDGAARPLGDADDATAWLPVHARVLDGPRAWWLESAEETAAAGRPAVAALVGLPLEVSGELAGSLLVASAAPRAWGPADRELLLGVADQAGQALVRTQLAQRDRDAALTLQEALAPEVSAGLGVDVALRYVPATTGTRVGGDWADCWRVPDGRIALVVGDVVGKGLGAAATMGRLRASLRALAAVEATPSVVLSRLDELESADGVELVATVLYALLDPASGRLEVACAGHLPLVVAGPDGVRLVEEGGSPPIGLGAGAGSGVSAWLPAGSTLVLYTDGLVERRGRPLAEGLDRLQTVLREDYADAGATADAVMRLAHERADDDIAVLVLAGQPDPAASAPVAADATTSHQTHLPESVE